VDLRIGKTSIETASGTIVISEDGRPDVPALLLCQPPNRRTAVVDI
jgi:hypothetical protein